MGLHDRPADGQTYPEPLFFRRMKCLEYTLQIPRRYSFTRILHRQHNTALALPLRPHDDQTFVRGLLDYGIESIDHQIQRDLLQLNAIATHPRKPGRKLVSKLHDK